MTQPRRSFAAAILAGLGLLHMFGIAIRREPYHLVMVGGGLVLLLASAIVAFRARRRGEWALRPWLPATLFVLASAGVAGALISGDPAEVELVMHDMPGFRIALPAHERQADSQRFEGGKVVLDEPGRFGKLTLSWEVGEPIDQAAANAMVETMGAGAAEPGPSVPVGANRAPAVTLRARQGDDSMLVAIWGCGRRQLTLGIRGRGDAAELQRRVLASFECFLDSAPAPAPADEGALGVVVDLPAGMRATETSPQRRKFEGAGGEVLTFLQVEAGLETSGALLAEARGAVRPVGEFEIPGEPDRVDGPHGPRPVWRGTAWDAPGHLLVSAWSCEKLGYSVLALHLRPNDQPEEPALALLLSARCAD